MLSKVDMHAYWTIIYAYAAVFVLICAQILNFRAEMRSDSHPFYPVQFGIGPVFMRCCVK